MCHVLPQAVVPGTENKFKAYPHAREAVQKLKDFIVGAS
jgi:hypothetical protein